LNKRKKNISILFISDERKEPVSFKLSLGLFKSIIFGIGVLCLLIIAGGVYYLNVIEILADYDNMKEKNARIEQYKKMIYRIQKKFETIESTDKRIRKLFGEKLNGENQTDINKNMKEENDEFMKLISENDNFSFDLDSDNLLTLKKFSSSSRYIPYLIPTEGFITKEFQKNDLLTGETHTGIDIAAKEGSMIRAVADGVVIGKIQKDTTFFLKYCVVANGVVTGKFQIDAIFVKIQISVYFVVADDIINGPCSLYAHTIFFKRVATNVAIGTP